MKFKNNLKLITIAVSAVISVAAAGIAFATEFGADDPLISKSYLDNVFYTQVTEYIDAKIASIPTSAPAAAASTEYQVITLTKGQTLYARSSMEFILRPGSQATVVSPLETNGIANVSTSIELYNGHEVPINNYCIIPRADGRGILCTSDVAYVMVRGAYEIA